MAGIRDIYTTAIETATRKAKKLYPNDKRSSEVMKQFKKYGRVVLDRHLAEDRLKFELVQCYPMLERDIYLLWREIMQKMVPSTRAKKNPYLIKVRRNMPIEIFNLMNIFIKENCMQPNEKKTQSTITLTLSSEEDLKVLFAERKRPRKTKKATWEKENFEDPFLRDLGRRGNTALLCGPKTPLKIRFPHSKQCVFVQCHFGYWNKNGVPQHSK